MKKLSVKEVVSSCCGAEALEGILKPGFFTCRKCFKLCDPTPLPSKTRDSGKEVEGMKDDLQKKFVAWRKDWIKKWIMAGIRGSMEDKNRPDNTFLIWDWFARYTITSQAQAREDIAEKAVKVLYANLHPSLRKISEDKMREYLLASAKGEHE